MRHIRFPLAVILTALFGMGAAPLTSAAQVSSAAITPDSIATALRALSLTEEGVRVNGRYVLESHTIAAGDTLRGPLVVIRGDAEIRGVVAGDVYALFGNVYVRPGAEVSGGATAWRGQVVVDGGRVRGAMRSSVTPAAASPMTTGRATALAAGWTGMILLVGFLVLVLAAPNLRATALAIEESFGRAFLVGVAGQLSFLPLTLLVVAALTMTILGILLIPFALVVAPVALAGLVTLGFTAIALVVGRAFRRTSADPQRGALLAALGPGIVALMLPWIIAALLTSTGTAGFLVKLAAMGITWVAATAGLGGAILSRAGTARRRPAPVAVEPTSWQTPTPIAGVSAARRPIPARPEGR